MASDTYLSIAFQSEGSYKEKGSKFLAFAYPVTSELEIKQELEKLKKKYYDARHHCYAYILGKGKKIFRANDDGEPGHSAGDPILGQINSNDLSDILVVVVRYFGGTKLGVGGLVQAYKAAAATAIANNRIIEKTIMITVKLNFNYARMNDIMKIIKSYQLEITTQQMALACEMTVKIREDLSDTVISLLTKSAKVERLQNI